MKSAPGVATKRRKTLEEAAEMFRENVVRNSEGGREGGWLPLAR